MIHEYKEDSSKEKLSLHRMSCVTTATSSVRFDAVNNDNHFIKVIHSIAVPLLTENTSMLYAPLEWQYAEIPSSAGGVVLCTVLVCKMRGI